MKISFSTKFASLVILTSLAISLVVVAPAKATAATTDQIGVQYQAHVQNVGWQGPVSDGQEAGTDGQALRVEALKLNLVNAPAGASIEYQAHVENIGWQTPVSDGKEAGTDGQALQIEAIKISLKNIPGYSIQYRVHVQNIGWMDWVSDGQVAGTTGKSLRIEAIEIQAVKISDNTTVSVQYQGHVENIGWQTSVQNGQIAGTEGQSLRVEALKIGLLNAPSDAHIKYQTHVQNIGWQDPVEDNAEGGTDGKSLRVEAVKIVLENLPGYSVQYRAHVQNIGWQSWVSDGQEAGTDGKSLRIEAIEIRIVKTTDGSTPTPAPFSYNIYKGADVYENDNISDYQQFKLSGVQVVIQKATQGETHTDSLLQYRATNLTKYGFLVGYYHYANNDSQPDAQAQHFLDAVNGLHSDTVLWLDIENEVDWNKQQAIAFTKEFISYVQKKGYKIGIYSGLYFYNDYLADSNFNVPIWLASYSSQPSQYPAIASWQYTNAGTVNGVKGNIDLDWFNNSIFK